MSAPLFSVIVPTYDRPQLLAEALASVKDQTIADFECLVIDDAGGVIPQIPRDERFSLAQLSRPSGPGAARNEGLRRARGRCVCFLDDDDTWLPERLAIALEGLQVADVAICGGQTESGAYAPARELHGNVHDVIANRTTPHLGQTALVRQQCPQFNERYLASQDIEWWLRVTADATVTTVQRPGFVWRSHGGPRGLNSQQRRVEFSLMLLDEYSDYFRTHRMARAFRWYRISAMARQAGDRRLAGTALVRSLAARPTGHALKESGRWLRM